MPVYQYSGPCPCPCSCQYTNRPTVLHYHFHNPLVTSSHQPAGISHQLLPLLLLLTLVISHQSPLASNWQLASLISHHWHLWHQSAVSSHPSTGISQKFAVHSHQSAAISHHGCKLMAISPQPTGICSHMHPHTPCMHRTYTTHTPHMHRTYTAHAPHIHRTYTGTCMHAVEVHWGGWQGT